MKIITQLLLFWCIISIGKNVFPSDNIDIDYTIAQDAFCFVAFLILFLGCGAVVNLLDRLIQHLDNIENN